MYDDIKDSYLTIDIVNKLCEFINNCNSEDIKYLFEQYLDEETKEIKVEEENIIEMFGEKNV